jgi:hypothetical protein
MDVLPLELFSIICSFLPVRVLGYLGSVNKHLRLVVDSDAILNKEKMAMYTSKWHFRRRVNDASTTILDRIKMKTINQRRWKLPGRYHKLLY